MSNEQSTRIEWLTVTTAAVAIFAATFAEDLPIVGSARALTFTAIVFALASGALAVVYAVRLRCRRQFPQALGWFALASGFLVSSIGTVTLASIAYISMTCHAFPFSC